MNKIAIINDNNWNYLFLAKELKPFYNKCKGRDEAFKEFQTEAIKDDDISLKSKSLPENIIKKALKQRDAKEFLVIWKDDEDYTEEVWIKQ